MTMPPACPACHAPLDPDARYCHRCGRAVGGNAGDRSVWLVAWALVILTLGAITWFVFNKDTERQAPEMANAGGGGGGGGTPPDISQMTPRDRFFRLHDRIMTAAGGGDTATAQRFAPMALQAYGMLDQFDTDVRYHAGVIHIQVRDYPGALALADTIQADAPTHLFAALLRMEVAEAQGHTAAAATARQAFVRNFDQELRAGRPEYQEHRAMLDDLRQRLGGSR